MRQPAAERSQSQETRGRAREGVESPASRRLVVVADDFGSSRSVNRAVALARDEGILTAATLMAGGEAFDDAVEIARARPGLSIGVHLTFCDGRAVLSPERLGGLAGQDGRFPESPARAGLRIWWNRRSLQRGLAAEMAAQLGRISEAGLKPAHIDGHHHLHAHPVLFDLACRQATDRGVSWIRIPSDDVARGKALEWVVFAILRARNRAVAARHGLRSATRVFGLTATGRIDEAYLLRLLSRLPEGTSEIFTHPALDGGAGERELAALTSKRVKERLQAEKIELSNYGNLV